MNKPTRTTSAAHSGKEHIILREAGAEAADMLARVHAAAFGGEKGWSAQSIAEMLAVEGTEAMLALARETEADKQDDGVPVGMIITRMVWGDGEILTLGVDPSWRQRGIGGRLLATAMNGMVMLGVNRVFLEVAEDNTAAITLYESLKFERMGRRPNYYLQEGGRRVDALMMVRVFGVGCGG